MYVMPEDDASQATVFMDFSGVDNGYTGPQHCAFTPDGNYMIYSFYDGYYGYYGANKVLISEQNGGNPVNPSTVLTPGSNGFYKTFDVDETWMYYTNKGAGTLYKADHTSGSGSPTFVANIFRHVGRQ